MNQPPDDAEPEANRARQKATGADHASIYQAAGDQHITHQYGGLPSLQSRGVKISLAVLMVLAVIVGTWVAVNRPKQPTSGRAAEVPFEFTTEKFATRCDTDFVLPMPPEKIDFSAPDTGEWKDFPAASEGISGSPAEVFLTVQGRTEAKVILKGIKIVVRDRRPAVKGTSLRDPCGGPGAYRWVSADLDTDPPRLTNHFVPEVLEAPDEMEKIEPIRFPYMVSASDPEIFVIQVTTAKCDCDWVIELSWSSGSQTGTLEIDDHGKPFRVTSKKNTVSCTGTGEPCGGRARPDKEIERGVVPLGTG